MTGFARAHQRRAVLAIAIALLGTAACGADDGGVGPSGRLVGGRCSSDADCDKRCVTDNAFPGGYCTRSCADDGGCPAGSACVALEDGICLALCRAAADCDAFGAGYTCNLYGRQSGGERVRACAGPGASP